VTLLLTIGVLTLMPGNERPHPFGARTQLEHVFAYFVAATAIALVYAPRLKTIRILAGLAAYGAALEFGRLFVSCQHAKGIRHPQTRRRRQSANEGRQAAPCQEVVVVEGEGGD
jgi:hypothetical protein